MASTRQTWSRFMVMDITTLDDALLFVIVYSIMDPRDIKPDHPILKHIFNDAYPGAITIFTQNWDECVFKVDFSYYANPRPPCIVRLEVEDDEPTKFAMTAALQGLAATILPGLVPKVLQVGKAKNEGGRLLNFSVTEFIDEKTLDDVWYELNADGRSSLISELAEAVEKLHSVRLSDQKVQEFLGNALKDEPGLLKELSGPGTFGGTQTGVFNSGSVFMGHIIKEHTDIKQPITVNVLSEPRGIEIKSDFEDMEPVVVEESDMDRWAEEAVFCHNNLNPNQIFVRKLADGGYSIAGILDWTLAGFYPASYELSLQDSHLGLGHGNVSFYLLLKDRLKEVTPRTSSQIALLRARELIHESHERVLVSSDIVSSAVRKKFLDKLELVRDEDPYVGWRRTPGTSHDCSAAEFERLEHDFYMTLPQDWKPAWE
ncbi:hypothetical protein jhhlp_002864 [Lomentospora prolificans]|uniref:Uncharacterized protein n=1 Tax=Lomentospora prolificans TaxID=41688 RepID=A0A2N3NF90_9PEZI|nr:hypothetical protein jhhlp_002864 [Lomentospora prolificans]